MAAAGHVAALRQRSAAGVATALGVGRLGVPLLLVGTVLLLGGGVWLVSETFYDAFASWLVASYALLGVALVLGQVGGTHLRHTRELAESDATPEELHERLRSRATIVANYGSALCGAAVFVLMVWKP